MKISKKVLDRVRDHGDFVQLNIGKEVLIGTALQGSQNYQLDDEHSDVDTKSLVVPSFESLVFNSKRTSITLEVAPTIEHADVKDFREMVNCWKKQNINFLEIIFTPYQIAYNDFEWVWDTLYAMRERIAHYNPYKALHAMCGNLMEKYHAFDHPYPSAMEKINKYGYDPKQLSHMLRFQDFLVRYFEGETFEKCLIPSDPKMLLEIKRGFLSLKEAREVREAIKKWHDRYKEEMQVKFINEGDPRTEKDLDELTYCIFESVFRSRKG